MELIAPEILRLRPVRRPSEKGGELTNLTDVVT
jgi:hypothetical protein